MKHLSADLLCAIVQAPRAGKHVPIVAAIARDLPDIQREHEINTPLRLAHFLAQIAHESDGFRTVNEYASGKAYEGRRDLGNTQPGDGIRFKGRGLIQLTGRANYRKFGKLAGLNLEASPVAAAHLLHVTELAALFWTDRNLNPKADADNLEAITKAINGGRNGLASRRLYLARAKKATGA
ncbi:glycoside hydrolase family 19 protein [Candidatus Raskinella chloraquaticus]|uniref:glycoside hydrolase family 19 protein n=1 Tax=Candidatus Raskinella chloraquaticus TaxID=1951219 RepID=UPI00366A9373